MQLNELRQCGMNKIAQSALHVLIRTGHRRWGRLRDRHRRWGRLRDSRPTGSGDRHASRRPPAWNAVTAMDCSDVTSHVAIGRKCGI